MTPDQDIERVLERWFADGPTQMPDRLFEFVDHIDRLPQRRRARLVTRFVAMNSPLRLAAAAVVILFVAGAGAAFLGRPASVGTAPSLTPTPTAEPSASTRPTPIPETLRSRWLSTGVRPSPGLASITIASDFLSYEGPTGSVVSSASLEADDRLTIRSLADAGGCRLGDEATYTFRLSADGATVTLSSEDDPCTDRSEVLTGELARTACLMPGGWCLGDLEPGTHTSGLFNPLSPTDGYRYGQLSYTVPAGWANEQDWPGNYTITEQAPLEGAGIYLFPDVLAHSQDDSCPETSETGIGRGPAALAEWLGSLPGLVSTEPTAVTVGGLEGFTIDVSVAPDWTHTCPYSEGRPLVSTFVDSDPGEGFDWNVGAGGVARYILLEQPDGNSLLISIEAPDQATWDALIEGAMPIVETFQFNP